MTPRRRILNRVNGYLECLNHYSDNKDHNLYKFYARMLFKTHMTEQIFKSYYPESHKEITASIEEWDKELHEQQIKTYNLPDSAPNGIWRGKK